MSSCSSSPERRMIRQAMMATKLDNSQPQDMPSHGKAEDQAEDPDIKSHRGIFGQMNIFIVSVQAWEPRPLLMAHKGSSWSTWDNCKIIDGRRGRSGPFQAFCHSRDLPVMIPVLLAIFNAPEEAKESGCTLRIK